MQTGTIKRVRNIDIAKGILIILVVLGHTTFVYSKYIYWFHMPVFFMLTGVTLKLPNNGDRLKWSIKKAVRLLIPYFSWGIISFALLGSFSLKRLLALVYGGRILGGVYWYNTCLLISILFFMILYTYIAENIRCILLIFVYLAAITESNILSFIGRNMLNNLPFPWNIDVSAIATIYIVIGYEYNMRKDYFLRHQKRWGLISSILILLTFTLDMCKAIDFNIDMKNANYDSLLLSILIPIASFMLLIYVASMIDKVNCLGRILSCIGQSSLVIMFIHIPIRELLVIPLLGENYNCFISVIMIVTVSMVISYLIEKTRIFNLPLLGQVSV